MINKHGGKLDSISGREIKLKVQKNCMSQDYISRIIALKEESSKNSFSHGSNHCRRTFKFSSGSNHCRKAMILKEVIIVGKLCFSK